MGRHLAAILTTSRKHVEHRRQALTITVYEIDKACRNKADLITSNL